MDVALQVPDDERRSPPLTGGEPISPLRAKWGAALDHGFVAIPSVLLLQFKTLRATPTEFLVALNLIAHWWEVDRKPFPRVTTIARRMDLTPRTVQRALNRLRALGLIEWDYVQMVNGQVSEHAPRGIGIRRRRYDLSRLVERADRYVAHRKSVRQTIEQRRQSPEIAT